ncbi:MAG: L-glutamine:2-deoxy-scyllo-inosose aminotransferase [Verrucomicrobiota bacterium]|jgi:dTDP-4-amino-4,6-dideoxygalactose transaminase
MKTIPTRRDFLGATALAGAGLSLGLGQTVAAATAEKTGKTGRAAIPSWPVFDEREDRALLDVLHSGAWGRGGRGRKVADFEVAYAQLTGAKHCVATASGTTSLLTALGAYGVGPGDEVILPVYTFVATFNVITANYALPVFVDSDPDSFQVDARKIAAAITPSTRMLLPVHIAGSPADMDTIGRLGRERKIAVIEDASQAWVAQWRGRGVGNTGLAGCFSFQSSKNLTSGEGGAIVTNDEEFADKCFNFQGQGAGRARATHGRAANYRMNEFAGGLLLAQMTRLEAQSRIRDDNAAHLAKLLGEIPGIKPATLHDGCTRSAHHLFMFRYSKERFSNLPRAKFLQALSAKGIPASGGYTPLNASPHVRALATNPYYQKIYGKAAMAKWEERNQCPVNDQLCAEAVWFTQPTLLTTRAFMEQIADTIRDIQKRSSDLAKT